MAKQKSYKDQLMELYGQGQQTGGTAQSGAGQQQSNAMLDLILSRQPFSYDAKSDPAAAAVRQETARNIARTTKDTMGAYAGMTGGMPSTAAVSAAAQAGNYAAAQGANKIAELKQLAYQNYQTEGDNMNAMLALMQQQEADAYSRDMAQKQWDYGVQQDEYNKQLAMAELKAQYGDYSGLKALGVDVSKYTSSGGGYYSSGGYSGGDDNSGGDPDDENYNKLLGAYPGGTIPAEDWPALAAQYGESKLIEWGFKNGAAQSGKPSGIGTDPAKNRYSALK